MARSRTAAVVVLVVSLIAAAVALVACPAVAEAHVVARASTNSQGIQADYESTDCAISADGRYVVFRSDSSNLITAVLTLSVPAGAGAGAGAEGGIPPVLSGASSGPDIYLRDLVAGTTELISAKLDGTKSSHECGNPAITPDGRYVAFNSQSEDLVENDTNMLGDVFVYDRLTDTMTLVSVSSEGVQGNGHSGYPSISADGRYIAFWSGATNFVPIDVTGLGDSNGVPDIFVRDMQTGTTTRVSVSSTGVQANGQSTYPSISADGAFVAFASFANTLVSSDSNGVEDVFVRDLVAGTTTRVSVSSAEAEGNLASGYPSINGNGRYVAFSSDATNLVTGDSNGVTDVFVRDRTLGTTIRVSVADDESQADDYCHSPSINTNGYFVAFATEATNLVFGYSNPSGAVAVRNWNAGTTRLVSISASWAEPNAVSRYPEISGDGRYVAFETYADNLFTPDTNNNADVLVALARAAPVVTAVSPASGPTSGGTDVTITGTGFLGATDVTFGGAAAAFTVDSATQITATNAAHAPGTVQVQVTAGGLASANTSADDYTYEIVYTYLKGVDRFDTAVKVSQAAFPGALPAGSGVVLAPGWESYQEALCGAPLAAAYGGPVLLSSKTILYSNVKAELVRLDPDYVFCIGLTSALATAVNASDCLPTATVVSINGAGAPADIVYDMSRKVANALGVRVNALGGDISTATAIVTIGSNFPDAIGVSPLACTRLWPIILTDQAGGYPAPSLHASATATFADLGVTKAIKVGTYAVLPGTVTGLTNCSGVDRYYTNANVAVWAVANADLSFMHTALTTGDKFPDALAAGPYLAEDRGTLLLSPLDGPVPAPIQALLVVNGADIYEFTFIACIEPVISQVKGLLP